MSTRSLSPLWHHLPLGSNSLSTSKHYLLNQSRWRNVQIHQLPASTRFFSSGPFGWWANDGKGGDDKGDDDKDDSEETNNETGKKGGFVRRRKGTIYPKTDKDGKSGGDTEQVNGAISSLVQGIAPHSPETIIIPHNQRPIFPGFTQALYIDQKEVRDAVVDARANGKPYVGLFMEKEMTDEEANSEFAPAVSADSFCNIGVFAQVLAVTPGTTLGGALVDSEEEAEGWTLLFRAHRRIELLELIKPVRPFVGRIKHLKEDPVESYNSDTVRAYSNELMTTLREVVKLNPMLRDQMQMFSQQRYDVSNPYLLADFAASFTTAEPRELQEVLEEMNLEHRMNLALLMLKKEQKLFQLQAEISQQVEKKISANQRKYFLNEQLKQIKKELGLESDDKEALLQKFKDRVAAFESIPEDANKVINEEMAKLDTLEKNSAEFNLSRTYLDWLTLLPWSKYSIDNFDLDVAKRILEEDHYGLSDIKERILEFIAVGKLRGSVQGKILLLVGPPGVGKTSIGKSIARALNREYYRFSVGGLSDVSEIKGHRRTYVGAMPGKVIQCLKIVNSSNPLILIDEIDKLGQGIRGDPASALLELLDPSQNGTFVDHYLDVPVDMSKVLFVCTANVTDTIPAPLLDRMEVLRLSGYDLPEKVQIARQYLEPRAKTESGITEAADEDETYNPENLVIPNSTVLNEDAIKALIRWYCREAGVRSLQQLIERVYRKVALKVVQATDEEKSDDSKWIIGEDELVEYVGQPKYQSDRLYATTPPGVIMGLAWTATGGTSLYIECTSVKQYEESKSGLVTTGQLGDVMKESSQIAYTHARHKLDQLQIDNSFFQHNQVHLHVPEGATPKDGPSAGVSMTTALLSLALDKPVRADLAMTGELSLTGMVLPVGGIKEKVIAARRSGVKCIVLPDANKRDVDELADYLKQDLEIHFAKCYDDVYNVAFGEN